jgi:hypothetical protein
MRFSNTQLDLWSYDTNTVCIVTKNKRISNKVNRYLKYYPDYTIKEGEEPVFKCNIKQMEYLAVILGLNLDELKKTSALIEGIGS